MEAREAADRLFAELPSTASTISLGDMANHLQEVMFVPWGEVIAYLHVSCVCAFAREEADLSRVRPPVCTFCAASTCRPLRPVSNARERERELIDNHQVTEGRQVQRPVG
jgi:hypothetical protein